VKLKYEEKYVSYLNINGIGYQAVAKAYLCGGENAMAQLEIMARRGWPKISMAMQCWRLLTLSLCEIEAAAYLETAANRGGYRRNG